MPPFVLTVLKILLLLLLYFFVYRAVRTIAADIGGGRPRARREPRPSRRRRGGPPKRLVMLDANGRKVSTHRLEGAMRIGREPECEIQPDDTYISQIHARVAPRGDGWVVEDMGSTNGTYLNQRKVAVPTRIESGDRIRIGKTILEVHK